MFSNPKAIVDRLGITPGMVVADVGSGSGEYSISLARSVGHSGKVYAIDVQKELLTKLKTNASKEGLNNIEIVWADLEKDRGTGLADSLVDVSVVANVLFQVEDPVALAKEAARITKPNGRIIIIDWTDSFGGLGPKPADVIDEAKAEEIFSEFGLKKVTDVNAGDHHYGLILQKV